MSYAQPISEKDQPLGYPGLDAAGFILAEQVPGLEALVDAATADIEAAAEAAAATNIDVVERSSDVSTVPSRRGLATTALTGGELVSALAICVAGGTFTKLRFHLGTPFTAVTDLRLGVHNVSAVKIGETANLIGLGGITTPAASTYIADIPLLASVTLATGDAVYLGAAFIGTTCHAYSASFGASSIAALGPHRRTRRASWAGGTVLPNLGTSTTGVCPWIELVP